MQAELRFKRLMLLTLFQYIAEFQDALLKLAFVCLLISIKSEKACLQGLDKLLHKTTIITFLFGIQEA